VSTPAALPDFAESAERLADERVRIDALISAGAAAARRDQLTGAQVEETLQLMATLNADIEELRRRHYPRAHRLVVVEDAAYLVSPTWRNVRKVWTRPQVRVNDHGRQVTR
jgi:hypothetical protein